MESGLINVRLRGWSGAGEVRERGVVERRFYGTDRGQLDILQDWGLYCHGFGRVSVIIGVGDTRGGMRGERNGEGAIL